MTDKVLEFACALIIDTHGRILLQQRDNKAEINHPGMLGLFGGHREPDETFLECVVREIGEELGYFVAPDRFVHMATFQSVDSDNHLVEIYLVHGVSADALVVTEGTLLIVDRDQVGGLMPSLTPTARAALQSFHSR